ADTSPGSISTSPRSNASSIAYSSLPGPAFYPQQQQQIGGVAQPYSTTSPVFANTASYPQQSFGHPSFLTADRAISRADGSQSVMLPPARSPGLGNPVSPSLSTTARDNYTTSTPGLHRHGALSPRSHADSLTNRTPYSSVPDTPRSVLSQQSLSLSPPGAIPPYTNAATMLTYPTQHDTRQQTESPPFADQETFHEISSDGQIIVPQITCRVEKGFFYSLDRTWTCYRRNYFSVVASYSLSPHLPNARLYLDRGSRNGPEQIQAMAVTLSAAVDGASGKSIELVQHTPKRDKGPQTSIKMEKLAPTPPNKTQTDPHGYPINTFHTSAAMASPYLPLQADPEQQYSPAGHSTSHQHTFERIQFKSATANNGKRRAQQQYYHLIVELYADVRRPGEQTPDWVRVAQRVSAAVVVRGRSPSHYQHEGPHSASSSRGGPGTGSGAGGPGHQAFGAPGAPGAAGRGLPNSLAMLGGAGMGGAVYRGSQYPLDPSPVGSHSVSSASSISGGPVEGLVGEQALLDEDSKAMDHFDGYQYYPSPLAEAGLPVGPKPEYDPSKRVKAEYGETIPSSWSMGSCGRFQGVETSRGYYPDLNAGAGY
ncbi:uncharacterized protein K452DRAFT_228903, partial [Aplosporella prunicola CBS 121167]